MPKIRLHTVAAQGLEQESPHKPGLLHLPLNDRVHLLSPKRYFNHSTGIKRFCLGGGCRKIAECLCWQIVLPKQLQI